MANPPSKFPPAPRSSAIPSRSTCSPQRSRSHHIRPRPDHRHHHPARLRRQHQFTRRQPTRSADFAGATTLSRLAVPQNRRGLRTSAGRRCHRCLRRQHHRRRAQHSRQEHALARRPRPPPAGRQEDRATSASPSKASAVTDFLHDVGRSQRAARFDRDVLAPERREVPHHSSRASTISVTPTTLTRKALRRHTAEASFEMALDTDHRPRSRARHQGLWRHTHTLRRRRSTSPLKARRSARPRTTSSSTAASSTASSTSPKPPLDPTDPTDRIRGEASRQRRQPAPRGDSGYQGDGRLHRFEALLKKRSAQNNTNKQTPNCSSEQGCL